MFERPFTLIAPVIVEVEVEAEAKVFDELHVDGGTGAQVFVYPAAIDWKRLLDILDVPESPNVYVIRNSQIRPEFQATQRDLVSIAERPISSLKAVPALRVTCTASRWTVPGSGRY